MQIHVNMPTQSDPWASSPEISDDLSDSEIDKDATTIRVNLRKLSNKALAEIGLQFCLAC